MQRATPSAADQLDARRGQTVLGFAAPNLSCFSPNGFQLRCTEPRLYDFRFRAGLRVEDSWLQTILVEVLGVKHAEQAQTVR